MKTKVICIRLLILCISLPCALVAKANQSEPTAHAALTAMKRATSFMTNTVSYEGGYVWSYLPDFSRRWGEMEAKPTMVWVQPPGTATMGHLYLDAYHITQNEFYYQAAQQVASALIKGQHPSGGWNYMFDLAGDASLKQWYETIGKNGWRLEEFHHYYGNATFDDAGTFDASLFLLRLYLEKQDTVYKGPLYKAINFVLESQYDIGGWPQRYPHADAFSVNGQPEYAHDITFNDDVAKNNIRFLLFCMQALNDSSLRTRIITAIHKGMDAFITLKLPTPQPGWALQYSLDLKPASARSYEPLSVSANATVNNLYLLLEFYRLTGDKKYLAGIPESLDWLDSLALPAHLVKDGRTHPRMIEIGSGKTLYLHRQGSNVTNGKYFIDYTPDHPVVHYASLGRINVNALRHEYLKTLTIDVSGLQIKSGLVWENLPELPDLYVINNQRYTPTSVNEQTALSVILSLNDQGYWPSKLPNITNPYIGDGPASITPGDYRSTWVGDKYDTSPYKNTQNVEGITLVSFLQNMTLLLHYLEEHQDD